MGQRKDSHPHLLRPVFFPRLCSFLKHPTCLIWLSGVSRNHTGERKDPEIQALAQSPLLGQFISLLLCLMCLPAPPLAILMKDSPEDPPAGQCWHHYVAKSVKEIQYIDSRMMSQMALPVKVCQQDGQRTSSVCHVPA